MDVERTVEFLLHHQAQVAARLDRVDAQIEALTGQQAVLVSVVTQQQNQINSIALAVGTLTEAHRTLAEDLRMVADAQRMLFEAERRTEERLDSLTRIFEDWLRRSGDGSRPE